MNPFILSNTQQAQKFVFLETVDHKESIHFPQTFQIIVFKIAEFAVCRVNFLNKKI